MPLDWKGILAQLTVSRLARLAASAGLGGVSRMRKAALVEAILPLLVEPPDDALKHEALLLFRGVELVELAQTAGLGHVAARKHELVSALLTSDLADQELELSEQDFLLPDRQRLDVPPGRGPEPGVEVLPSRPGAAEQAIFFEIHELLRRRELTRVVLVAPSCHEPILTRVLSEGLDDLIESAARGRPQARDDRPLISVILDGTEHGLDDTEAGRTLVSLAKILSRQLEIRLTVKRRLEAKVFVVEEARRDGTWLTGLVGSSLSAVVSTDKARPTAGVVEAHMRVAGAVAARDTPASLLDEWVNHLLRESRSLAGDKLERYRTLSAVTRKVAYKLDFDTSHELRLKHLAERLCRRGRFSVPMFDPSQLAPPGEHQWLAVARSAASWRRGLLLCDARGTGKTVQAGLILARELRRRRVYVSREATERRRGLVIAPAALHGRWHDELTAKWGLSVSVLRADAAWGHHRSDVADAQVLICTPQQAVQSWEDLQGVEILVVDDAHLLEEQVLAALSGLRGAASLCLVLSATPAQHDLLDVLPLAALVAPDEGWESLAAAENANLLAGELFAIATRASQPDAVVVPARKMHDRFYELDDEEARGYQEVRRMRSDYLARSGAASAWAFVAIEQCYLSSLAAFHNLASALIGDGQRTFLSQLDGRAHSDGSLAIIEQSGYFRRRLRSLRDQLVARSRPEAPVAAKEAALLELVGAQRGKALLIVTRHRATQRRIVTVLARARIKRIEQLDDVASLHERLAIAARFGAAAQTKAGQGPSVVMVATDDALGELNLHRHCATLINYDLPWNPQLLERRIRCLQRWGRDGDVAVYNLAARDAGGDRWSMDTRVLYACRKIFSMATQVSDALFEIDPLELEESLTSDAELSLLEDPDPDVVRSFDQLLRPVERADEGRPEAARLAELHDEYRTLLADFWQRVSYGGASVDSSRGYLFGRLQLALLQGQVGVLCAPAREPEACTNFHVAVGLRLLFESAVYEEGGEPLDDDWLLEDEEVYLWAVTPDGALGDWTQFLLSGGLAEVPRDIAVKLAGEDVVEFLVREKRALEARELDALPLAAWSQAAPPTLAAKLEQVADHATKLADKRRRELEREWDRDRGARVRRLEARLEQAADQPLDAEMMAAMDAAIAAVMRQRVQLRHDVLATQLFLVTS